MKIVPADDQGLLTETALPGFEFIAAYYRLSLLPIFLNDYFLCGLMKWPPPSNGVTMWGICVNQGAGRCCFCVGVLHLHLNGYQ